VYEYGPTFAKSSTSMSCGAVVTFASSTLYMRAGMVIASSEYVGVNDEAIVNVLMEAVNKRCIENA
jgi:hypothetical protein